ncbi:hypothetical protein [Streptomyces sp. NPDC088739]|uniref:hypothetical protein n=1 Tax=Streptomyces sp. NPDC088739 TaxID=3365882 RepID=UPI00382671FB
MHMTDFMRPGAADEGAEPYDLQPAEALAEIRDALAGWIADALTLAGGRARQGDDDTAPQLMASLYDAATALAAPKRGGEDFRDRVTRAGRHLGYAADQVDSAIRLARANTRPHRGTDPELDGAAPGLIRTFYAAAVAYVRQASDIARGGLRIEVIASWTRCEGGSFVRPCSHGREETHILPSDDRCEGAQYLVGTWQCVGPVDAVIIRDVTLGLRHGDLSDQRGVRACIHHGPSYLRTLDRSTRVIYPGPSSEDGQGAIMVYKNAAQQDADGVEIPKRVDR